MRVLFTSGALAMTIVVALLSTAQGAGASTTMPAALSAELRAAPALNVNGALEIRLRWSIKEGWLPDGGFNLYRTDRKTPLNTTPIGGTVNLPTNLALGGAKPLPLHDLLNQAITPSGVTLPH